jgi:hypothetical protein
VRIFQVSNFGIYLKSNFALGRWILCLVIQYLDFTRKEILPFVFRGLVLDLRNFSFQILLRQIAVVHGVSP